MTALEMIHLTRLISLARECQHIAADLGDRLGFVTEERPGLPPTEAGRVIRRWHTATARAKRLESEIGKRLGMNPGEVYWAIHTGRDLLK